MNKSSNYEQSVTTPIMVNGKIVGTITEIGARTAGDVIFKDRGEA